MRHDRESSLCVDRVYRLGPASCQYRLFDEECEKVSFVSLEFRPGDDERDAIRHRPCFPASAPAVVVRHRDGREPEMSRASDYLGRPRHRVGRMHRVDVEIDLQSGHLSSAWSSPSHDGDSRLQWSRERVEVINCCQSARVPINYLSGDSIGCLRWSGSSMWHPTAPSSSSESR